MTFCLTHYFKNLAWLISLLNDIQCECSAMCQRESNKIQDGRLAPACFSQEYKYFVQHLPTVKNETTVQNPVYESFLQTSIPSVISIFYAKEGLSRLFVRNFLSHSTEKVRWGTLRCIRKFRVSKNFMHKKGISLNSVEKFLSHSADKIRRRTLLCFERILLSKIFKQRRGEASRFWRIFFYLTGPKNFAGEPFCVSENFW